MAGGIGGGSVSRGTFSARQETKTTIILAACRDPLKIARLRGWSYDRARGCAGGRGNLIGGVRDERVGVLVAAPAQARGLQGKLVNLSGRSSQVKDPVSGPMVFPVSVRPGAIRPIAVSMRKVAPLEAKTSPRFSTRQDPD
jgi:hypothetical protein